MKTNEFEVDINDLLTLDPTDATDHVQNLAGGQVSHWEVVDFKGNGSTVVVVRVQMQ